MTFEEMLDLPDGEMYEECHTYLTSGMIVSSFGFRELGPAPPLTDDYPILGFIDRDGVHKRIEWFKTGPEKVRCGI